MRGHECYHCKQWVEAGEAHDCWTTTEAALTRELSDDLREAWERLRETAADLGEQRIYASHNSIMFARKACYFFVRPKRKFLEVCVFLARPLKHPRIRRVMPSSKTKYANMIQLVHRDEVEAPLTDWLQEAYGLQDAPPAAAGTTRKTTKKPTARPRSRPKPAKSRKVKARKKAAPRPKRKTTRR
jgi:Domain of unknown function (DUF5655)